MKNKKGVELGKLLAFMGEMYWLPECFSMTALSQVPIL